MSSKFPEHLAEVGLKMPNLEKVMHFQTAAILFQDGRSGPSSNLTSAFVLCFGCDQNVSEKLIRSEVIVDTHTDRHTDRLTEQNDEVVATQSHYLINR